MRRATIIFFLALCHNIISAQSVGVGTNNPHPAAALDVTSTSKGFLLPLMSQTQRLLIASPAEGLLVYDTTQNRFYQYQEGVWRFLINNDYWVKSLTRDVVLNSSDSVGIGISAPQHRLDINGDTHVYGDVILLNSMDASGAAQAGLAYATGNMEAAGALTAGGNINGGGSLIVENGFAKLQLKNNGVDKAFIQNSINDLVLGTNPGNAAGEFVVRMNGDNQIMFDSASMLMFRSSASNEDMGKLVMGDKLAYGRNPTINSLPLMYGHVFSDGFAPSLWPASGNTVRVSTGVYDIDTNISGISSFGTIVVTTAGSSPPRVCTGRFTGAGVFRVEIFSLAGTHVNNDFYFIITDPLN